MLRLILMIATFSGAAWGQEIVLSANPSLLFSTANLSGPWGGEGFINSPNNKSGPLGGESYLGSFNNESGIGLSAKTLSRISPYVAFVITPDDILESIAIKPIEITPVVVP